LQSYGWKEVKGSKGTPKSPNWGVGSSGEVRPGDQRENQVKAATRRHLKVDIGGGGKEAPQRKNEVGDEGTGWEGGKHLERPSLNIKTWVIKKRGGRKR